ncbi:MAG: sigma-70 family RNA polymerase sigma factor [Candidatus Omnitrophica bacterium]|nr:sigma-70 family RNA polymerase sigma factor [Candidatus Omnitrophota bacterium]
MNEIKLFARLKNGDEGAREEIFQTHQTMVAKIAWRYSRKSSLSFEEMLAEGYVGLLQAINKFNPKKAKTKKTKFSTYAFWWIRRYIIRALVKEQSILSVPESVSELMYKYNRFAGILAQDLGREPTEMEVGKFLALSAQQLASISPRRVLKKVSWDEPISTDEGSGTLADFIPAKKESMEKTLERVVLIEKYFSVLTPPEKAVLNLRFGLQGQPQLTYQEIAGNLQKRFKKPLSRQRIHQISRTALKKIIAVRKKEKADGKMGRVD